MKKYALFNDDGDCIVLGKDPVDDTRVEVPGDCDPEDLWRSPAGKVMRRKPSKLSLPDTVEVGMPLSLPARAGCRWTVDGQPADGSFTPTEPGRLRVILHGRYSLHRIISAVTYAEQRAAAYPPIGEQFDMIYHQGIDAWRATIDDVKKRYPKPENE